MEQACSWRPAGTTEDWERMYQMYERLLTELANEVFPRLWCIQKNEPEQATKLRQAAAELAACLLPILDDPTKTAVTEAIAGRETVVDKVVRYRYEVLSEHLGLPA